MNRDDTIYIILLILSIPLGFLFKNSRNPKFKSIFSTTIGFLIALVVCQRDIIHSLFIVFTNFFIIKSIHAKYLPAFSFLLNFGYLLFFRTCHLFGLSKPLPYANAIQLILTLKIVGLSFEIYDSYRRKLKLRQLKDDESKLDEVNQVKLEIELQSVKQNLNFIDLFCYCYCYIGVLTGPYFKFKTHRDWIDSKYGCKIDAFYFSFKRGRAVPFFIIGFLVLSKYISFHDAKNEAFYLNPLWYRLIYMILVFTLFRFRFYIAWIFAEISCITAAFGAYPSQAKPKAGAGPTNLQELKKFDSNKKNEYSFECIHNIDEYMCEVAPTVKEVMRHWNMSVQYWMANYVYKRIGIKAIRQPLTMFISAYWHGIHPGYFLSMLTTTPCVLAESLMYKALKTKLDRNQNLMRLFSSCTWLFRTREFDYMSIGFILLDFDLTLRYWRSVYFCGHAVSLFFILFGLLSIKMKIFK